MSSRPISRRIALKSAGVAAGALVAGRLPGSRGTARADSSDVGASVPGPNEHRRWHQLEIIGDEFMDAQLLSSLDAVYSGMGDIGECLDTASRIVPGDDQSYFDEWFATAERVAASARKSRESDHPVSAGHAYLRASNYYRASEFIEHDNVAARRSVDCFRLAIDLLSLPIESVEIPYEDTTLPGYFFRSPLAKGKTPVLIVFQGFDGTPEETKNVGDAAMQRGYHCLIFAGPGQGLVLREKKLIFRYDWEKVVSPVVDFVLEQPGTDPDRIALLGISFGGHLAPRAVAFEPRIKACVTNPGMYDFHELTFRYFGDAAMALLERDPEAFNALIGGRMETNTRMRMALNDAMLKFGAATVADLYSTLEPYDNTEIVGRIECNMLVMDGTEERISPGQAKMLYDALPGPKEYVLFDEATAASLHCQTGATGLANETMFNWLDEQFRS